MQRTLDVVRANAWDSFTRCFDALKTSLDGVDHCTCADALAGTFLSWEGVVRREGRIFKVKQRTPLRTSFTISEHRALHCPPNCLAARRGWMVIA